jgi:hypothetical protein
MIKVIKYHLDGDTSQSLVMRDGLSSFLQKRGKSNQYRAFVVLEREYDGEYVSVYRVNNAIGTVELHNKMLIT